MADYLPKKEQDLIAWANNFVTVAMANLVALGLTASDLNTVSGGVADMSANLDTIHALKTQLEAQTVDKNENRHILESSARGLVKTIQANPGVSDSLKVRLGLPVASGVRDHSAPITPASLLATPHADGTNIVQWHRNGNKPTTAFVVLAKPVTGTGGTVTDDEWTIVGATMGSRFKHTGQTPGAPMAYRVLASRAGRNSNPTSAVTVYYP